MVLQKRPDPPVTGDTRYSPVIPITSQRLHHPSMETSFPSLTADLVMKSWSSVSL